MAGTWWRCVAWVYLDCREPRQPRLVKIVAGDVEIDGELQGFDGGGVEGAGVAFADLHATVAEEEGLGGDDEAVLVEGVARNEEVGDAGLVFK